MAWGDWKQDDRPQRGMWAPGDYIGKCFCCGDQFVGDKRARECADCAYGGEPERRALEAFDPAI